MYDLTTDSVFVALVIVTGALVFFMLCGALAHLLEAIDGWIRRRDRKLQDTLWRELFGRNRP